MHPVLSILSSKLFRRCVSILVLLALVLGGTVFLGQMFQMERGARTRSFFTQDTEYDVLFYGSSHVINGIFPMYLWETMGIPSYNLSGHGCRPSMAYWLLKMTLPFHKPKAAVLDVLFSWEENSELTVSLAHNILDPFPASPLKTQAILDLYAGEAQRGELLFPLDVYHNRWKELDPSMVRVALGEPVVPLTEKGAESRITVEPCLENYLLAEPQEQAEDFTREMGYVVKFIELCQKQGIVPVITYLPCKTSRWSQMCCNRTMAIARDLGALTLDLEYENPLNDLTDWADGPDHVNPAGALKLTAAVGAFLRESLDLPDRRQEEAYGAWQEDLKAYYKTQEANMLEADTPEKILTLAALPGFRAKLELAPGYENELWTAQIEELGSRGTLETAVQSQEFDALRLTVWNAAGDRVLCRTWNKALLPEGGNP